MPTRRCVIEAALVAERVALWSDVGTWLVPWDWESGELSGLIRRIRLCSEALGYPTDWLAVPLPLLRWYDFVETVPALGIAAQTVDWADAGLSAHAQGVEIIPIPDEAKEYHSWKG